ncbi:MAG: choice-of-anchor D domain-containing protein, partial [Verrucomicrobiaceae bacterium]
MHSLPPCSPVSQPSPDFAGDGTAARSLRHSLPRLIRPPAVLLSALLFPGAGPARAGQVDAQPLPPAPHDSRQVTVLPNGNIVLVTRDAAVAGRMLAGTVHLYNGTTLQPMGVLTGFAVEDQVGSGGIVVLPNSSFLIRSPLWDNGTVQDAGAVTWCSGTAPLPAEISAENSLVGGSFRDFVGQEPVQVLKNGNYVVPTHTWDNGPAVNAGAATWGSAATGVAGLISPTNSLVGGSTEDYVGWVTPLANGNYVVQSPAWDNGPAVDAGAVTWCGGAQGRTGLISAANSLVGSGEMDNVGFPDYQLDLVTALDNGHFLVLSPNWSDGRGAVTWVNGTTGITGEVSAGNSLVGVSRDFRITLGLPGGDWLVQNSSWNESRGAVTRGSGAAGLTGEVSEANSLTGPRPGNSVGGGGIVVLGNGNYVVRSPYWSGGEFGLHWLGAVTWVSGTAGTTGVVSELNSLVGSHAGDGQEASIMPGTPDGRYYLVISRSWNKGRGAITWCDGTVTTRGVISPDNSLVDLPYQNRVTVLANGNYVVNSVHWRNGAGAVTWGSAAKGVTGPISPANSLVGEDPPAISLNTSGSLVTPLANGNYVVSNSWRSNGQLTEAGCVTWCSGTEGRTGVVSVQNSLLGDKTRDRVAGGGIIPLANGHFIVVSPEWRINRGAVTWGRGTQALTGAVSEENSLVGANRESLGYYRPVALPNGNYVVSSPNWNEYRGAATWVDGAVGITGSISPANSLTGSRPGDQVGLRYWYFFSSGVIPLANGNYVVHSSDWNGGRGAFTWANGATGVRGEVSEGNSLVGLEAQSGGVFNFTTLSDGNYLVNGGASDRFGRRLILGDGWIGTHGTATDANSIIPLKNPDFRFGEWFMYYDAPNSRLVGGHTATGQLSLFGYVPEMAVRFGTATGNAPIPHGQTVPEVGNGTDFGEAAAARDSVEHVFTILNTGMEPLHLAGTPPVILEGPDAADFTVSVTALPASGTVAAAGGAAEFRIIFKPSAPGVRKAVVRIPNDDRDES